MRVLDATTFRLIISLDGRYVDFFLRQEVAGKVFYCCQCGGFRTHEVDLFSDFTEQMRHEVEAHMREAHTEAAKV